MKEPLDNLLSFQREYQRFIQKLARKHNLTIAEWNLLQRVSAGKNSQEMLADDLKVDISTLSRQLGKLTEKAFVLITKINSPNVHTRKSYQYHLSANGKQVLLQMNHDFDNFTQKVFAQWTDEEKQFLKILINRLSQSMQRVIFN